MSETPAEANRQDALKSTSPRMEEGQAVAKLNALRHGFGRSRPWSPGGTWTSGRLTRPRWWRTSSWPEPWSWPWPNQWPSSSGGLGGWSAPRRTYHDRPGQGRDPPGSREGHSRLQLHIPGPWNPGDPGSRRRRRPRAMETPLSSSATPQRGCLPGRIDPGEGGPWTIRTIRRSSPAFSMRRVRVCGPCVRPRRHVRTWGGRRAARAGEWTKPERAESRASTAAGKLRWRAAGRGVEAIEPRWMDRRAAG
jgi:hypothetical protein